MGLACKADLAIKHNVDYVFYFFTTFKTICRGSSGDSSQA